MCVSHLPGVERTGVVGRVVVVVCRPLTLRITGSIRQSWIHWRGRGGRGGGERTERATGLRTVKDKRRNEKSDENEMCLIFWWRQGGGLSGGGGGFVESEDLVFKGGRALHECVMTQTR